MVPPIFKVDPIGKVLMFKVNDYLEIKDLHVPTAYLDEFCEAFKIFGKPRSSTVDVWFSQF